MRKVQKPSAPPAISPQKERTRRALREALLELLETESLDAIKIRDLTDRAQVGYASFFRHYESKDEILDEVARQEVSNLLSLAVPLVDVTDLSAACKATCSYVHKHRTVWAALIAGGASATLRDAFVQIVLASPASKVPQTRKWLPLDLGIHYGVSAALELIAWWLKNPGRLSQAQVAIALERLVVAPTLDIR